MLEKDRKQIRRKRPSRKATPQETARPPAISPEERRHMIADAAYFRAQRRGSQGGDPERDWIEAEAEIDALLLARR